jgi:diguanylate cyclase (GGDEF)-like protein/PAS domain S-box-containing protein
VHTSTLVGALLIAGAALQVVATVVAVALLPESGTERRAWMLVCLALVVQAGRRVYAATLHTTLLDASADLLISALLLAGIIGIRSIFHRLRSTRQRLDEEVRNRAELVERVGTAVVVLSRTGRVLSMNRDACDLVDCDEQASVDKDWFETFVDAARKDELRSDFERMMSSSDAADEYIEYAVNNDLGLGHRTVVWHQQVVRDGQGRAESVRAAGIDMTDRAALERALAFESRLLNRTTDVMLAYQPDGMIVYANDTACAVTGRSREQLIGSDVRTLMPQDVRDTFEERVHALSETVPTASETTIITPGGSLPFESRACLVHLDGSLLIVDALRDITDRQRAETLLKKLAFTDPLTGVSNRRRFEIELGRELAKQERLGAGAAGAVVWFDLDEFKEVNDSLGHAAGDRVLASVGEVLRATTRPYDVVARLGGDEFGVLVPHVDRVEASRLASRLLEALSSHVHQVGDRQVRVTASMGMARYPEGGRSSDELLRRADLAMYESKAKGGNHLTVCEP